MLPLPWAKVEMAKWLWGHLEFIEVSDNKKSGTNCFQQPWLERLFKIQGGEL